MDQEFDGAGISVKSNVTLRDEIHANILPTRLKEFETSTKTAWNDDFQNLQLVALTAVTILTSNVFDVIDKKVMNSLWDIFKKV